MPASRRRRAFASLYATLTRAACRPRSFRCRLPMTRLRSNDFAPVASWASHNGVIAARRTSESIGQSPLNFGATSRYQESARTNIATGKADENRAADHLYAFLNDKGLRYRSQRMRR